MICKTCNGLGYIDKPDVFIEMLTDITGGEMEIQRTNFGGIDSCPLCQKRSEVEYLHHTQIQHLKGNSNDKRTVRTTPHSIPGAARNGEAVPPCDKGRVQGDARHYAGEAEVRGWA